MPWWPGDASAALAPAEGAGRLRVEEPKDVGTVARVTARYGKQACLVVMVLFGVLVAFDAHSTHYLEFFMKSYIRWTSVHAPWSLLLFLFVTCLALVCTMPCSLFFLAAGPLFATVYGYRLGLLLAVLSMAAAEVLSGCVALLVGRWLLRSSMQELIEQDERFRAVRAVDRLIAVEGVQLTVVMKLAPLPSGLISYLLGCTPVALGQFALGSTLVSLPYAALACVTSTSAARFDEFRKDCLSSPMRLGVFVLSFALTVAVVSWLLLRTGRRYRELQEAVEGEGRGSEIAMQPMSSRV